MNYTLEDKMTSLRAVSIAVLFYIFGYALKLSVLLFEILTPIISSTIFRLIAAGVTGTALSSGLLIVSLSGSNKLTPYAIAFMDGLMLLMVFDVFNSQLLSDAIKSGFISFFMAFIGYQLITVFAAKYEQSKSGIKQTVSEINIEYSEKQQILSDLKQELSEVKQTTCGFCEKEYSSKNALNAHVSRCKENPKNKKVAA
ncbi:hypothetical protein CXF68_17820 [Tenacibaculum sp. Bg11-29]|uniref:hypothetical protein n=1 Tax=Tenacibaculum sp. Bg11-29 TaxID=2058306 RepID=UPI000C340F2B|nr:hypothetical protein [Tenacibaculum sp. Bg11-29]PKH52435.1 hypothetical protein CXF68_17820 [Tenacibaculum sp. Bg11-29]